MKNELIEILNKVYSVSEEKFNNVFTPFELTKQMVNALNYQSNKTILVLVNLEFLIELKSRNISLDNVYYSSGCKFKREFAINLGLNVNNIFDLEYNNKEIKVTNNMAMKFDYMVGNPPYNPNSLWKKFVLKGIDLLNDNGKMVFIHPDSWRTSSKFKNVYKILKNNLSHLHICGNNVFENANIATDWYVYNKQQQNNCQITYSNSEIENKDLSEIDYILSFSNNSIPGKIYNKITSNKNNGIICLKGWDIVNPVFKQIIPSEILKYKQCGGKENGNGWCKNIFTYTEQPTKHQFESKVVMAYVGHPRAKFFDKKEEVGVLTGFYWLTDNDSLPILLNSKMYIKLYFELTNHDKRMLNQPLTFLRSLNFDNLNVQSEEELYIHYNLTQEEIDWIEQ